jgi:hypothetical protein
VTRVERHWTWCAGGDDDWINLYAEAVSAAARQLPTDVLVVATWIWADIEPQLVAVGWEPHIPHEKKTLLGTVSRGQPAGVLYVAADELGERLRRVWTSQVRPLSVETGVGLEDPARRSLEEADASVAASPVRIQMFDIDSLTVSSALPGVTDAIAMEVDRSAGARGIPAEHR